MFPIFIFTGMGSEPQNAFLPPCGCFRRKQKQQMPCAAAALPVKKRIPENLRIFRNSKRFRKIRRFFLNLKIKKKDSSEYGQSATEAI